jgi:hypothetical protein
VYESPSVTIQTCFGADVLETGGGGVDPVDVDWPFPHWTWFDSYLPSATTQWSGPSAE